MTTGVAIRTITRAPSAIVDGLGEHGVATIHEAQGRSGLMSPSITPASRAGRIAGSAVTVSVPPGDNWMIHVALELVQPGDILVVAPTSASDAGYFGDLLGVSARAHGVRGLVIDAGCRDVVELERLGFPVWSRCISAAGTVKATLGSVNLPLPIAGTTVHPGDVVVADEDGVVVVPCARAAEVLEASRARDAKEEITRARYAAGELSLDVHGMREALKKAGLVYVDHPADAS